MQYVLKRDIMLGVSKKAYGLLSLIKSNHLKTITANNRTTDESMEAK